MATVMLMVVVMMIMMTMMLLMMMMMVMVIVLTTMTMVIFTVSQKFGTSDAALAAQATAEHVAKSGSQQRS